MSSQTKTSGVMMKLRQHRSVVAEASPERRAPSDSETPFKLIAGKACDSDRLDEQLQEDGIELIAPNRANRFKSQDGRVPSRRPRAPAQATDHFSCAKKPPTGYGACV